ncbi:MAG: c-type cytochrome biogenesis protein CcmI [Hyphomicrobiaceae bacterium]|nr:c-type cytochrome biogenesis protein CcmI [Hyphomicrobiaceae bacterium]
MLLWIVCAVLTAVALAAVVRPLLTSHTPTTTAATHDPKDLAVYRDQLTELENDLARGVIAGPEAELSRREIARRMLRVAEPSAKPTLANSNLLAAKVGLVLAATVPLLTLAGYITIGSPGLPARPFTERKVADVKNAPLDDLIVKVEAQLARNPDDGKGWDVIAPVYFRLERFDDAARAFQNATRILGETTNRLEGFAEATVMANNGIVVEPARAAYERLNALEPSRVEPKFWLTLAKEQDGKTTEAVAGYKALLAGAEADAPWRPLVEQRLAAIAPNMSPAVASSSRARGPGADDVKAAESMTDTDRNRMISGMIDGLAARLKKDGNDAQGWQRLVQAYVVTGDLEKAKQASTDAKAALKADTSAASILSDLDAIIARAATQLKSGAKP